MVTIGITTAPRPRPTLEASLESLWASRFTGNVVISSDGPCQTLPLSTPASILEHPDHKGVFKNWAWLLSLLYLVHQGEHEYVYIAQDDVTWARQTWEILTADPPKAPFVSLYVDPKMSREFRLESRHTPGWQPSRLGGDSGGALCYGFSREGAKTLLNDSAFQEAAQTRPRNIDRIVPAIFWDRYQIPCMVRIPGLVHHRLGSGNSSIKVKKPRDTGSFVEWV